jgi:hypothetical protein
MLCVSQIHQLYINFTKAYEAVRREVFFLNNLTEVGIATNLGRLIKMRLN